MSIINFPVLYIPDPNKGKPLFYGQIYVGEPDLDPEVEVNQKQLNVVQEDGTVVPVAQPFVLSTGGVPVYNGNTVRLDVDGNYSIKILDKNGSQEYYIDNVYEGQPVTIEELPTIINDQLINDLSQTYNFDTLAEAVEADFLIKGKVIDLKDRTTGDDGGAIWDVVDVVTVTPNGIDIVACVGVPTLALKLRTNLHINLDTMGLQTETDLKPILERAKNLLPLGGKIICKKTAIEISDTILIDYPNINIEFIATNKTPIASFPSINLFNVTGENVKISNPTSDASTQDVTLFNIDALAENFSIENVNALNFGGQVIVSAAKGTKIDGVFAANCSIGTFTAANGVIALNGDKGVAQNIEIEDSFGKAIAIRGNDCELKGFEISRIKNQGTAGGICVYVGFETSNNVISKGVTREASTHLMKLSGGSTRIKVSKVNFFNDGDTISTTPNALLEISGVSNSEFFCLYFNWNNGAGTTDALARFVFHTGPDYPTINNIMTSCIFNSNTPSAVPRAINIVGGGVGLESSGNVIDNCSAKGTITIGATAGDTDNVLQNSKVICESFIAVETSNSINTLVFNNEIINTRARAGSDDYLIRSDSSTGLTVKGNTLRGQAIGIRSNDPDLNVTDNDFRMAKNADSIATVRNMYMVSTAAGIYANNNLREATSDVGAGLLTTANNNVTSAL